MYQLLSLEYTPVIVENNSSPSPMLIGGTRQPFRFNLDVDFCVAQLRRPCFESVLCYIKPLSCVDLILNYQEAMNHAAVA